ncbi:MAG: signal peptidase I [Planctomycetota bacterium]
MNRDGKQHWLRRLWQEWGKTLLIVGIVMTAFRSAVADWNDVPTGSMKPTILEGDRILVNKLAYDLRVPFTSFSLKRLGDPERGDIAVLYSPADGVRLVKRVIGLPGDRIELRANRLFVNGEAVSYDALDTRVFADLPDDEQALHRFARENLATRPHAVMSTPQRPSRRDFGPITVPRECYWVMGDNRDESNDSRFFGLVPRANIVGRASAVALSFDPANWYLPRWHRFFHGL